MSGLSQQELMKKIMEITKDPTLSDAEKAIERQNLMSGKWKQAPSSEDATDAKTDDKGKSAAGEKKDCSLLDDDTLKCAICFDLCVRPVTAPCQHNFCLKCFQDLVNKAKKKACPSCRHEFGNKFAQNPRINTALTVAIRAFKAGDAPKAAKAFVRMNNEDRPDEAFTTERAQRAGRANASSGRIMVNIPNDHFGPIPAEADPRGQGIRVGEFWKDRLDCRQWGAHFPHVAGIAGQSNTGAQSVVLSGGYEDDRDEGEWFLYTGSGGRDLSGNKRTNKEQSFDQAFENMNKALKMSCTKGLPVRVVRSFKEKRSAYAPTEETPVRYDGIYRIAKCWRTKGKQGFLMCRFLFVRCDNEPAPWSAEDFGDRPGLETNIPEAAAEEVKKVDKGQVFSMNDKPWWDWNADKEEWGWSRDPPVSLKTGGGVTGKQAARKKASEQEKALKEFACGLCKNVMLEPISTPCGHNFCKPCLDKKYGGIADEVDAGAATGRSLRVRKTLKPCPTCKVDICDFLKSARANLEMAAVIRKLQDAVEKAKAAAAKGDDEEGEEGAEEGGAEEEAAEEEAAEEQQEQEEEAGEEAAGPSKPAAAVKAAKGVDSHTTTNTDASGGGGKEAAVSDHQMPSSVQPPAAVAAPAVNSEAAKRDAVVGAIAKDFSDFDAGLIEALLEQEDGDEAAVKYALRKMRNQVAAEEKKRQRQAKLDAGKAAPGSAEADAAGGSAEAAPSKGKAGKGKGGKRSRAASAEAAVEEEAGEAKKVKA
ncbi:E3 ubiquitin-ligase ORTHRUS 2-like [Micractinium conductrix]|uniref:E3 ubiquitin-ligase ORTHRUS 2-like n=1 Tax=Micractinium conductrix TaxID=554055 RepID=A0A2P6VEL3_9CHLO|nr:E3 ubiquitin-ligase ORTHRUS 2-like [Micractinium conductrix]|eukprot:PSC72511.1 E3 ubiquitin-ligase ORTHRUS 2-like [Micractinium conductrix]